ncbi:MAG: 2'-5' RNA ligase family protein [bacterium]|nr:2'-5' RNA ligase family protein [bacterium]
MKLRSLIGADSAIVFFVPELDSIVERARSSCPESVDPGIAAHITVNYPFMIQENDLEVIVARLADSVEEFGAFEFRLTELRRWPTTLYLKPEPDSVFRAIIAAVWKAFPQSPPYGGRFQDVVPHLTIVESSEVEEIDASESELRTELTAKLPIAARASELHLIVKSGSEWNRVARVSL